MSDSSTCRYCRRAITFGLSADKLITPSWAWRTWHDGTPCRKAPSGGMHCPIQPVEGIDY